MARYRYTTVDSRGKTVTGQLEADSLDDARERLAELGLPENTFTLEEVPEQGGGRLSGEEAAQLASQTAELAKAGLPLGAGLRALAEELPRRRLQTVLRCIADRIDAGQSLEEAMASQGRSVPEYVRCLFAASIASGRFAEVLQQLVASEGHRSAIERRMRIMFAYPMILLGVIAVLFVLFSVFLVPQFGKVFHGFDVELPVLTHVILRLFSPIGGLVCVAAIAVSVLAVLLALAMSSRVAWLQRALYLVPLVGPYWRFRALAEFSRLMGLLVDLGVPLPQALSAVASRLREADLRAACRASARLVEAGVPLSEAMARRREFPASFRPLVQWGERTPALADAFRGTTEMCEGRLGFHSLFTETVILPITLVVVAFVVGLLVFGLMLPLISLIQHLS